MCERQIFQIIILCSRRFRQQAQFLHTNTGRQSGHYEQNRKKCPRSFFKRAAKYGFNHIRTKNKIYCCTESSKNLQLPRDQSTQVCMNLFMWNPWWAVIIRRIMNANRCYYGQANRLRFHYISTNTKYQLYKTIIKAVVTYGCKTWTLTKNDEQLLARFERSSMWK